MNERMRSTRTDKPSWATNCKKIREQLGLSQEDLALKAEVSQATISQIERGSQEPFALGAKRLGQYLRALNLTLQEFEELTGLKSDIPLAPISGVGIQDSNFVRVNVYPLQHPDAEPLQTTDIPAHLHRGKTTRAYHVDTDSMAGNADDAIPEGAIIYVDTAENNPTEGHKYILKHDGKHLIGMARTIKGDIIFIFYNSNFLPIRSSDAQILGRIYHSIQAQKH